MPAADLENAAEVSYERLSLRWTANTLGASFQAYITACSAIVTDATPNDRSVGNWMPILAAISTLITAEAGNPASQALFNKCVEYTYRFNMAAFYANVQSRISASQATALLAAYNTHLF